MTLILVLILVAILLGIDAIHNDLDVMYRAFRAFERDYWSQDEDVSDDEEDAN